MLLRASQESTFPSECFVLPTLETDIHVPQGKANKSCMFLIFASVGTAWSHASFILADFMNVLWWAHLPAYRVSWCVSLCWGSAKSLLRRVSIAWSFFFEGHWGPAAMFSLLTFSYSRQTNHWLTTPISFHTLSPLFTTRTNIPHPTQQMLWA